MTKSANSVTNDNLDLSKRSSDYSHYFIKTDSLISPNELIVSRY